MNNTRERIANLFAEEFCQDPAIYTYHSYNNAAPYYYIYVNGEIFINPYSYKVRFNSEKSAIRSFNEALHFYHFALTNAKDWKDKPYSIQGKNTDLNIYKDPKHKIANDKNQRVAYLKEIFRENNINVEISVLTPIQYKRYKLEHPYETNRAICYKYI